MPTTRRRSTISTKVINTLYKRYTKVRNADEAHLLDLETLLVTFWARLLLLWLLLCRGVYVHVCHVCKSRRYVKALDGWYFCVRQVRGAPRRRRRREDEGRAYQRLWRAAVGTLCLHSISSCCFRLSPRRCQMGIPTFMQRSRAGETVPHLLEFIGVPRIIKLNPQLLLSRFPLVNPT